jgi:hypothetical protein
MRTFTNNHDIGVVFVYCNYNENQSCEGLLCGLLQQLLQRHTLLPPTVQSLYKDHIKKGTRPSIHECSKLLQSEISSLSKTFIVVDALDECSAINRTRFLVELQTLRPKLSLLITTRPHIAIPDVDVPVCLEIRGTDHDIRKYIDGRIQKESKLRQHIEKDPSLHTSIIDAILDKAKGMSVPRYEITIPAHRGIGFY